MSAESLRSDISYGRLWWQTLTHPGTAGRLMFGDHEYAGFNSFLLVIIVALYSVYGFSMGMFGGAFPAAVSALKLPILYLVTIVICLLPLYVANVLYGPRLSITRCVRLLLLLVSANAMALVSYAPVSYFFALTTSDQGYAFLVLMHVGVLAFSGTASIMVNLIIIKATAHAMGQKLRPGMLIGWAVLYGLVGIQAAWTLRPWICKPTLDYAPLRPIGGSFIEAVLIHFRTFMGT